MKIPYRAAAAATAALLGFAGFAAPAMAKSVDGSTKTVSGTYSGSSTATGSGTDPISGAPTYTFDLSGTYSDGYLGSSGTYSGTVTIDYTGYSNTNPCATATGTVSYTTGGGKSGTLVMNIGPGSTVCETSNSNVHDSHFVEALGVGSTGRFAGATAASITSDGTSTGTGPYSDAGTLSGSVTS